MTVGDEFCAGGLWKAGTHMAVMDRRRLRGGFRPAFIQLRMHSHWRYRDTRTGIQRKPIIAADWSDYRGRTRIYETRVINLRIARKRNFCKL